MKCQINVSVYLGQVTWAIILLCWIGLHQRVTALSAINGTLAKVDTDVILKCSGSPVIDANSAVKWFRGSQQLSNSDKYKIGQEDINSTLTVIKAGEADIGPYRCTQFTLEAFPQLLSKPVVTKLSTSYSVTQGDALSIQCSGWGWPTPYVLWTREEYFKHIFGFSDPNVRMGNVTTKYNLTLALAELNIGKMNYSDQAGYMCVMVNDLGHVNTTTYVRVKDPLAAVWPCIGIIIIVLLLVLLIILGELKRRHSNKVNEQKED